MMSPVVFLLKSAPAILLNIKARRFDGREEAKREMKANKLHKKRKPHNGLLPHSPLEKSSDESEVRAIRIINLSFIHSRREALISEARQRRLRLLVLCAKCVYGEARRGKR
jgi:hypothetical protein